MVSFSSEASSGVIRIYDGRGDGKPLVTIDKLHRAPVHVMTVSFHSVTFDNPRSTSTHIQYSDRYDTVISADENGFVEYWQPREPFEPPKATRALWSFKTETDLLEFKKVRPLRQDMCRNDKPL